MLLVVLCCCNLLRFASADYWSERQAFLHREDQAYLGGSIVLNEKEKQVNDRLMDIKLSELNESFIHPEQFLPAQHFFLSKDNITQSKMFDVLKKLPKGASLHGHELSLASFDVVYNLTFENNLYACIVNDKLRLKFFSTPTKDCNWELVALIRNRTGFEDLLRSQLTIVVDDPLKVYPDGNAVWKKFQYAFNPLIGLLCYRPVFIQYFLKVLEEYYEDNVKYMEFRSLLPEIYELDGTTYSPEENVRIYVKVLQYFKQLHPDFIGAKLIYSPSRKRTPSELREHIRLALLLQSKYPDFIAGFDLVGQEDAGYPLTDFVPDLLQLSGKMKFFFHAGETDWNGFGVDDNVIDAVLLNTSRIGHGFAILKHPELVDILKQKGIAIEVNPISNQVLRLVDDLRNHPAAYLMSINCPLVIGNDDPGLWGSKALSYDWYMAYMGMATCESDLRFLKQLALNSILYSALSPDEMTIGLNQWNSDWNIFLDQMLNITSV